MRQVDQRWRLEPSKSEILPLPKRTKGPAMLVTSNLVINPRVDDATRRFL